MKSKKAALACFMGFAVTYAFSAFAQLPKTLTYENIHCYGGKLAMIKHTKAHIAYTIHFTGTLQSNLPDSPVGLMSSECVGVGSVMEGVAKSNGFCEFIDQDGDKYMGNWDRTGKEGKWTVTTGTGKFTGISGGGSFQLIEFPRGLSPGMFSGCSNSTGTYTLP